MGAVKKRCSCPIWLKCFIGRYVCVKTTCGSVYGTLLKVTPQALVLCPGELEPPALQVNRGTKTVVFCCNICYVAIDPILNSGTEIE